MLSTATWSILSAPEARAARTALAGRPEPLDRHRAARHPARAQGHGGSRARAGLRGRVRDLGGGQLAGAARETIELLGRMFQDDPPDMLLLETVTLIREPATYETVELLLETGLPVWLSFRRCRHGVCGVYGQHWGPPEGDLFGRAARRFEEMGVERAADQLPAGRPRAGIRLVAARLHASMPLGVYPNLGHLAGRRWRFDDTIGPRGLRRSSRSAGATRARRSSAAAAASTRDHIAALGPALADTKPGRRGPQLEERLRPSETTLPRSMPEPWLDDDGTDLFPLPLPDLTLEPGVFVPTQGSFLVWKHLFRDGHRLAHALPRRRLRLRHPDGAARAQRRRARARDRHRSQRDREHARQRVSQRRLRPRDRRRRRPLPVATGATATTSSSRACTRCRSIPYEEPSGHRPLDYWGRNLLDHFLALLPTLLDRRRRAPRHAALDRGPGGDGGCSTSAASRRASSTSASSRSARCSSANKPQIERVEQLSDAYHLSSGATTSWSPT